MSAAFFLSGAAMIFCACGLRLALKEKLATALMMLAGFALMGLVFSTDPTLGSTSRTWHGILHDAFFVILGLALMPSMLLLGFVFRQREQWKNLSSYTWATVALAVPHFG
jgi:hypothetical protein